MTESGPLPTKWSFDDAFFEAFKTAAAVGVLVSAAGGNDGGLNNGMDGYSTVVNAARERAPAR